MKGVRRSARLDLAGIHFYDNAVYRRRPRLGLEFRVTHSRATLISVKTRNVTLSIPDDLLRQLKITAARQETSISAMLTRTLRQIANEGDGYEEAQRQMLNDVKKGYRLGTHGKIGWTRDELHER